MIAGLEDITSGELYIDGELVNDVEPKDRDIAMVFQSYALYPHMNVYDNIAFGMRFRKEPKDEIEYDDFAKLQFVVGEIIECEEVKKSKKLLCSKVRIGDSVKQIVSGIKAYYSPEEMVGKKVMVLLNLKPATLAGVVSEGMILCAEDQDGNLSVMTPEKDMESGSEIL